MIDELWDDGAQPERTALAWSRTALAGVALVGLLVRLLLPVRPGAALVLGIVAVPALVAVALAGRARYRVGERALLAGRPLPDGRLFAACVALTTLAGIGAALYIALP